MGLTIDTKDHSEENFMRVIGLILLKEMLT